MRQQARADELARVPLCSPVHQVYAILAGTAGIERDGADVVATSALEVLSLDRTGLQRALDAVPGLGSALLTAVAERLVLAERRR